jgi:hypothetical protein
MTNAVIIAQQGSNNTTFRNRIINGAMVIDQRYGGTATTNAINGYNIDRFQIVQTVTGKLIAQQNAGSVTPPAGFVKYQGITSQSAYSVLSGDYYLIQQAIEGVNIADLSWGTANAKTVTLSFWVYSSLTGTFGGSLRNNAGNRSYPFTYTISAASTWEQKTITVAGDTSGTWVTDNTGAGIWLAIGLGVGTTNSGTAGAWASSAYYSATGATSVVGTNGATFYITGVQLEAGSTASPFENRSYGVELALCQRYYQVVTNGAGGWVSAGRCDCSMAWSAMRAAPTIVSDTVALWCTDYNVGNYTQSAWAAASTTLTSTGGTIQFTNFTGSAGGRPGGLANQTTNRVLLSAEL